MHFGSKEYCDRIILITIFLFLIANVNTQQSNQKCPIGFTAVSTINYDEIYCIKLKGPESFADIFVDCADNLFTSKLYQKLDFIKPKIKIWADYVQTVFEGGPFIDWPYMESTGNVTTTIFEFKYDQELGVDDELCTVITATHNLTVVKCNEQHYRYCAISTYDYDNNNKGCESLNNSKIFWSPRPACISFMTMKGGDVGATWRQSKDICLKHGSKLLHHGWLYANHPLLYLKKNTTIENSMVPLGIMMMRDKKMIWLNSEDDNNIVPDSDWNFKNVTFNPDRTLLALQSDHWKLVNNTFEFYDVICESSIPLKYASLYLSYVDSDTIELSSSVPGVNVKNIRCFTDSDIFNPSKVNTIITLTKFLLKPIKDGYYWCKYVNSKNFRVSQSEKKLFIRKTNAVTDLHAIKIKFHKKYNLVSLDKLSKIWSEKLVTYIYLRTKLKKGEVNVQNTGSEMELVNRTEDEGNIENFVILKRVYLDLKTVLFHVHLKNGVDRIHKGNWEEFEIQSVKPAYYCKAMKNVPSLPLGENKTMGCKTYSCEGNFNDGVQWVETSRERCNTKAEEQLQIVMKKMHKILNSTQPFSIRELDTAFDDVDILLDFDKKVDIPGEFLNLLDELGSKAKLNGTTSATTVLNNIALMVADAGPDSPYRGIRIARQEDDGFTKDTFHYIYDTPKTTDLLANSTEVLAYLPSSMTDRRLSFVVFRNDGPFYTASDTVNTFTVNSRILSIKVENFTQFSSNEFVEIHFHSINDTINENLYRACAFWEFFEDGSGHWSTDGCTYVVSTDPDLLNSCRCNHLTHFAEILVPFTNFSSSHEKVLEIISLVACSISMIGVILIGLTAVLFRSWRKDFNNKIWLQLCIAIFILHTVFIVVVFSDFQGQIIPCMLVGILLHYSVLASFCWMLVTAIISFRKLVLVFTRDTSHKLFKASAFAWGFPCVIVGILLSVDPRAYGSKFQNHSSNPAADFCYPSGLGLWLSVYAPIAVMLVANWTLFALIERSVFASRKIQRYGDSKEAQRCATVSCLLVFLFGLPWIFGLFANNIVAAYLFTLTANFQGFVLFVFFVLSKKKTRDLWMNKLQQTRNALSMSSIYKSSSSGWKGASCELVTK